MLYSPLKQQALSLFSWVMCIYSGTGSETSDTIALVILHELTRGNTGNVLLIYLFIYLLIYLFIYLAAIFTFMCVILCRSLFRLRSLLKVS